MYASISADVNFGMMNTSSPNTTVYKRICDGSENTLEDCLPDTTTSGCNEFTNVFIECYPSMYAFRVVPCTYIASME